MKKKFFSFLFLGVMCLSLSLPVLANSESYSLTVDHESVNGSDNGIYYDLDEGDLTLSGSVWVYSYDPGHNLTTNTVYFEVWRRRLGIDDKIGQVSVTPNLSLNSPEYFSDDMGSTGSDDYYIKAFKIADDGNNIKSSGTISTD